MHISWIELEASVIVDRLFFPAKEPECNAQLDESGIRAAAKNPIILII